MDLEDPGLHCGSITVVDHASEGGCHRLIHNAGLISLIQHRAPVMGGDITLMSCNHNYELRLDENGEGWIQDIVFTPGTILCGFHIRPCVQEGDGRGDHPWHIAIEHDSLGNETAQFEICLDLWFGGNPNCEIEGDLEISIDNNGDGEYGASTLNTALNEEVTSHGGGSSCANFLGLGDLEFAGVWDIDGEDAENANLEIEHLEP